MRKRPIFNTRRTHRGKLAIAAVTAVGLCVCIFFFIGLKLHRFEPVKELYQTKQERKANDTYVLPVQYKRIEIKVDGRPQVINSLKIDLNRKEVEVKPVLSEDEICGFETTSSMLSRKGGYAGVNGSFFHVYGQPFGMLVIDKKVLTSSQGYPVFGVGEDNKGFLEEIQTYAEFAAGGKQIKVNGINRLPINNDIVLMTGEFGTTTKTSTRTLNIIVKKNIVKEVKWSSQPLVIPQGTEIIVSTGRLAKRLEHIKLGQQASINVSTRPQANFKNAIECGAWIIKKGKLSVPKRDPWIGRTNTREPRTAIGLTQNNKLFLVTIDGRQPGKSIGFTGKELADYMLSLSVYDAAFLDGGGSTTMWVDGKQVNTPSFQGRERKVGNAVGVFVK